MKVLIVGKGGREHAIGLKIKESSLVKEIYFAPGNGGMKSIGKIVNICEDDIESLGNFAKKNEIDLTIVGPESSLSKGIVDEFQRKGLKIFGPTKEAIKIESSKEFAKEIMEKYNIPTGKYKSFNNFKDAFEYIKEEKFPIVIKEDGLKSGKGVTIVNSLEDGRTTLDRIFQEENKVLIEEFLKGREFSIIGMVNGDKIIPLEIAQDHKRAYDKDMGDNTGGMGVYSPVDWVSENIINETMEKIMKPMGQALVKENIPFCGFLFGGIMVTEEGVKTIEFNGRFGDPEAQGILPRLEDDLVEVILELLDNKTRKLKWKNEYTLGVVLASKGYPHEYVNGYEIENVKAISRYIYHMGTKIVGDKLLTNGGRVLTVLGKGETLEEARVKAYENVSKIKCENLFYRKDIGQK